MLPHRRHATSLPRRAWQGSARLSMAAEASATVRDRAGTGERRPRLRALAAEAAPLLSRGRRDVAGPEPFGPPAGVRALPRHAFPGRLPRDDVRRDRARPR